MLSVTHTPTQDQLATVTAWNEIYLDCSLVAEDQESVLFFLRDQQCIGYVELEFSPGVIYISWFCAPRNGSVCMELMLDYLANKHDHRTALELNVGCQSFEHPKAVTARLNLYFKFGFKILETQWCGPGHVDLRMARWLKEK